jgi:hypothetical protein
MNPSLLLSIAIHAVGGSVIRGAVEECGELGVMSLKGANLTGVDMTQIRKCAGHPNGRDRGDVAPGQSRSSLFANSCAVSAEWGCHKNYCWAICDGYNDPEQRGFPWCWLAHNDGYGKWMWCGAYYDCRSHVEVKPRSRNCGKG